MYRSVSTRAVIIGAGRVGSHCAMSLIARRLVEEIVLIDTNQAFAKAQATDLADFSTGMGSSVSVREGSYADCNTASFVGGLTVAFLMILILLVAIGNIGNLSFRLPNLELLDEIGGAVLGFVKGFLYCVLLCWLLSFLGLIIGKDTLESTTLAQFFLQIKFLTSGLL